MGRTSASVACSNVSAEIYVVCTGYLAPSQLDPKLLDGKHVFSELPDQIKRIDIFHPEVLRLRHGLAWPGVHQ